MSVLSDTLASYGGRQPTPDEDVIVNSMGGHQPAVILVAPTRIAGTLIDLANNRETDVSGNALVGSYTVDPGGLLKTISANKGILLGTSIQGGDVMGAAGPAGYATRQAWIADNVDLYVPGYVMMGDNFNPSLGSFNLNPAKAFLDDARAKGKKVRGHVIGVYPKRDIGTWIDTYLQQNPGQWQTLMAARIDAICGLLAGYTDIIANADVVNELFSAGSTNPGGWRTNPWNTAAATVAGRTASTATQDDYLAPVLFAIARVRQKLPGVPLFWCQDQTEQLGSSTFNNLAQNTLAGITAAIQAGAVVDGYAQQAHMQFRLSFSAPRLRSFLQGLVGLGLKIIVSEIDVRTGYGDGIIDAYGKVDTPAPTSYSAYEYERIASNIRKQYLDVALPIVQSTGGGMLVEWTLDNGYNSWMSTAGEMPCAYTADFQPTPQLASMRDAVLEL
jgi:GH35 family endo-1,4-beta-xylanase